MIEALILLAVALVLVVLIAIAVVAEGIDHTRRAPARRRAKALAAEMAAFREHFARIGGYAEALSIAGIRFNGTIRAATDAEMRAMLRLRLGIYASAIVAPPGMSIIYVDEA